MNIIDKTTREQMFKILMTLIMNKHIGISVYGLIFSLAPREIPDLTMEIVAKKLNCSRQAISKSKREWDTLLY